MNRYDFGCKKSGYCEIKGDRVDISGQSIYGICNKMVINMLKKEILGSCWAGEYLFKLLLPAEFFVSGHILRNTFVYVCFVSIEENHIGSLFIPAVTAINVD